MTLRCAACGVRVKPDDAYCRRCGARNDAQVEDADSGDRSTLSITDHLREAARSNIDDEETLLWRGSFCSKAMFREAALAAVLTVILWSVRSQIVDPQVVGLVIPAIAALWLLVAGLLVYRKLDANYTVTNQRLLHRHGILYRSTHRIETIDIDDLRFEQGIFEQMLGIGRIVVCSSDATHDDLVMYGIDHVERVFDMLEKARRRERLQHGLHVEAI